MRKIGLTGGIGSGKSTVSTRLAELGAVVIDADAIAREVVEIGSPGLAKVIERFGVDVLADDGSLNRPALSKIVFADQAALADLNAITHPLVGRRAAELEAAASKDDVVVYDTPLLVELKSGERYDKVVIVMAPTELRLARLAERGLSAEDALARMARQASDDERRAVADVLIDNSGSLAELWRQVDEFWHALAERR